jgi:hypothetical protein
MKKKTIYKNKHNLNVELKKRKAPYFLKSITRLLMDSSESGIFSH